MDIKIVPYAPEHVAAVRAFNQRLTGTGWAFYETEIPSWIPFVEGQRVWREYYLAVDDEGEVHGAYCLKPQEFAIRGEAHVITNWQGPISEGIVDSRYSMLGIRLITDMLKRRPMLFSWGMGSPDLPLPQILRSLGWRSFDTPFCIRVMKPFRFLRHNGFLRTTPGRRRMLDLLAWSGLGALAIRLIQAAQRLRSGGASDALAHEETRFGPWADALFERCRDRYGVLAVRDAATMNALLPSSGWPESQILRIERAGETIGYSVAMITEMAGDPRFGSLCVGSVIDVLSDPEDAHQVVAASLPWFRARGVDLVCSNQSHPAWIDAFASSGFLLLPRRRTLFVSKELERALAPFDESVQSIHLTLLDGDGPRGH